ncbi:HAMP domain-containing protein [Massilia arenosa]|uniref:HAMP domain-containing protein n=1 Tax=Zemynaea arenosa TaxID=2561931 RepID=A0A4Y9SIL8_9BURK|nr:methyl-accepting chemotaxis protein [Massilia arenosa]TFW25529.1 HAMP domain-containing protein [Massilia arenosa]
MKFQDLKIGQRLGAGFGAVIALVALMGALSYSDLTALSHSVDLTTNDRYPKIVLAHGIKDELNETARHMRNVLLMTDDQKIEEELAAIERNSQVIARNLADLDRTVTSPHGRELLASMMADRTRFIEQRTAFVRMVKADREKARPYLLETLRPTQMHYMAALDQVIAFQTKLMDDSADATEARAARSRMVILGLTSLTTVLAVLVAWLVRNSIVLPLREAVAAARRVAEGDLTGRIEATSRDETGELLASLRDMNANLLRIVREVRTGTDTIAHASGEIATGNLDLSSRTEQQAGSLEETASSMEELTTAVHRNSDNARQANALASNAAEVAVRGGAVVQRVVQTMSGISESSRRIEEIIAVIDGIAFQTNILALNAAVEAARAGEQGRGFAVVASEVRNLAQRSATAAKEIKQLIDTSVEKVAEGSQLVGEAGSTMDELVDSVRRVTGVLSEISTASSEQDASITEINTAITEMDSVTQQNAALVEEAAAAAESLQEQAARLSEVVAVFQLDEVPGGVRSPAVRAHGHAGAAALRLAA